MRLFLIALIPAATACVPPCQQLCRKVLFDCDLDTERIALEECQQSCERQELLYLQWDDGLKFKQYNDHRRCIIRSTCEEIEAGECYDGFEELFLFDLDKVLPEQSTTSIEDTGPSGA